MNNLIIGGAAGVEVFKQAYPNESFEHATKLKTRKTNYYDLVLSFHYLQTLGVREGLDHLKHLAKILKPKGQLYLFVPAFEWAADQIINEENPSPITMLHTFGNQLGNLDIHKSGWTMRGLRRDLALAGFAVTHANIGYYTMTVAGEDGKPKDLAAGHHIVIAYKREESDNVPYQEIER